MKNQTTHLVSSNVFNFAGSPTTTQHDINGALVPRSTVSRQVVNGSVVAISGTLALPVSGTLSGSFAGPVVDLLYSNGCLVNFMVTGAFAGGATGVAPQGPPTGSFSLWGSGDLVLQDRYPRSGPVNWFQITQNDANGNAVLPHATLGSGSVVAFNLWQLNVRWIQPRWTHTAGSGSIDCWCTKKGI